MTTIEKIRAELMKEYGNNASDMNWSYRAGLAKALDIIKEHAEQEPTKQREKELAEEWRCGYEMGFEEAKVFYEQEPCEDAISRNDMLDAVGHGTTYTSLEVQKIINGLPSVNPVPCDDVISREMALEKMADYVASGYADSAEDFEEYSRIICQLPSVRPQEQTGHWIRHDNTKEPLYGWYFCSECNSVIGDKTKFCSNCGAKMVEPQESEVRNEHKCSDLQL